MKISIQMLVGTILAGLVYGLLGELLYRLLNIVTPSPVLTLVYYGGLFAFIGIVLAVINNLFYSKYVYNGRKVERRSLLISIGLAIVCALLLEFIYDLVGERNKVKDFDSYVFVVDNSASMVWNDEKGARFGAIEALISDKPNDFEFAVYTFDDYVYCEREMAPKSEGLEIYDPQHEGETHMYAAMKQLINDQKLGVLDMTKNTRVIVITDGAPNDVRKEETAVWMDLLNEYGSKGITVSTVALKMDGISNEYFLRMIAEKTDGVFVKCSNADKLDESFVKASQVNRNPRNLFGFRPGLYMNVLLGIMRVIFVVALGLINAVMKTAVCERFVSTKSVLLSSVIGATLAGIGIEIGMNGFGINAMLMRVITCVLLAVTVLDQQKMINQYNLVKNGGQSSGPLY